MSEDIPDALTKNNTTATGTSTDGVILTIDANGDVLTDIGTFLFGDTLLKKQFM